MTTPVTQRIIVVTPFAFEFGAQAASRLSVIAMGERAMLAIAAHAAAVSDDREAHN